MGSMLSCEGKDLVSVFEQPDEMFVQNNGGLAFVDMNTKRMQPVNKIYIEPNKKKLTFRTDGLFWDIS